MFTTTAPATHAEQTADMRATLARAVTGRDGWQRHTVAGIDRGRVYPATGAVVLPAPVYTRRGWVERWVAGVPADPGTWSTGADLAAAIVHAESLPPVPPAEPTHYDGHGAPCWCDQPNAAR